MVQGRHLLVSTEVARTDDYWMSFPLTSAQTALPNLSVSGEICHMKQTLYSQQRPDTTQVASLS